MRYTASYVGKASTRVALALTLTAACGSSHPAAPAPDYSFVAGDFSPADVRAGDSTMLPLSSRFLNGFSEPVTYAFEGPGGFSVAFSLCNTVYTQQFFGPPPGVSCNATVLVNRTVTPGVHALAFIATSSSVPAKRTIVPLAVLPARPLPQTFLVTASARTMSLARGDSADVVFTISPRPLGADNVTFTVSGAFVGIALRWIPSPVVGATDDSVRVRITVNQNGVFGARTYFFEARLPGMPPVTRMVTVDVAEVPPRRAVSDSQRPST